MGVAPTTRAMSTKLLSVADRAKQWPQQSLRTVAHVIDAELLAASFDRLDGRAATGVDGVTKEAYGQDVQRNLQDLHRRLCTGRYRHQPIRRVQIPKSPGKTRPIGISTVEDKVVQGALAQVLEALYEPVFHRFSYGFRRGMGAHDAMRELHARLFQGRCGWVLETDIQSFFDSVDRARLMEMLRQRVSDEAFLRLVGKCLHVQVLDGEQVGEPEVGTVQGSALSPMLGNIYLHHVLDDWFVRDVQPRLRGEAHLVRYADDAVMLFEHESDARRVMEVLPKRMARYGLALAPDKTRLVDMRRPPGDQGKGKGQGTVDFLGFTVYWRRSRKGFWVPAERTRKKRLATAITAIGEWCRRHRHDSVRDQHATLSKKLRGHYAYFGVNGNFRQLQRVYQAVLRLWYRGLSRRSQRALLKGKRFQAILDRFPLPKPQIKVLIWRMT